MLMDGLHILASLRGCRVDFVTQGTSEELERVIRLACSQSGLTVLGSVSHEFSSPVVGAPGGSTGLILLAESHVAYHTWPELSCVTVDIFVCNYSRDNSTAARELLSVIASALGPEALDSEHIVRQIR